MNPLLLAFVVMWFLYLFIGMWAVVMYFPISILISIAGMFLCTGGWYFTKEYT